ncbi:MAG: hypothetical protein ACTHMC_17785, partial [Pseudobacter sp.]|uniref:hypothetical protein n=1 Tax=Pseudobacter sp. TaxID=2045420 RepID=UPI003F7E2245
MKPTNQFILQNLEVAPPEGSWNQLSARLDTEFNQAEQRVAQKLEASAMEPPAGLWSSIAESLPFPFEPSAEEAVPARKPARVISVPLWKVAVAAAVFIVLSYGGWYLFRTPSGSLTAGDQPPVVATNPAQAQASTVPSGSASTLNMPPSIAQQLPDRKSAPLPVNHRNSTATTTTDNSNILTENEQQDLPSTDPNLVRAEEVVKEVVSVPAKAIRDASGKMVMDMNLITTPGNHYVTVTAPNGEQTRMSRKFLPVLTFLNTGADNGQFSTGLKQKIQELKKQLLQQASFVPSATNFLDIMELKELLQDK